MPGGTIHRLVHAPGRRYGIAMPVLAAGLGCVAVSLIGHSIDPTTRYKTLLLGMGLLLVASVLVWVDIIVKWIESKRRSKRQ